NHLHQQQQLQEQQHRYNDIDEDEIITAVEFLANQEELEREAAEALPRSIDICSYAKGSILQPIYSCLTCARANPSGEEPLGICYACHVQCHTSHEIVELSCRRAFRCDCGTTRMPPIPSTGSAATSGGGACLLQRGKRGAPPEPRNVYDPMPFAGRFCWCRVQYDHAVEAKYADGKGTTMYQCVRCEDWFHDRCIAGLPPKPAAVAAAAAASAAKGQGEDGCGDGKKRKKSGGDQEGQQQEDEEDDDDEDGQDEDEDAFDEFFCWGCVDALPFLRGYEGSPLFIFGDVDVDVDVNGDDASGDGTRIEEEGVDSHKRRKIDNDGDNRGSTRSSATGTSSSSSSSSLSSSSSAPTLPFALASNLFCVSGWRDALCRCAACSAAYASHGAASYLGARTAPASEAELLRSVFPPDADVESRVPTDGLALRALARSVDRVAALEGVQAFREFAERVKAFLGGFARDGRVVTREDVQRLFGALAEESGAARREREEDEAEDL
ncbi:hypothetical protein DFJ73DRAFT_940374, partial [Zopfochytrium polystomum]